MKKSLTVSCYLLLVLSFLLSGCQMKRIINQDGFIQTVTIDRVKDEPALYYYGITFPELKEDGSNNAITLGLRAHDFQEAMLQFQLRTKYTLVLGQIRNVIFGKSIWENDIFHALEELNFQPKFPLSSRIMMYDGEARELLQKTMDTTNFDLYNLMIKLQRNRSYSLSTLFNFVRDHLQPGIEPVSSIIKLNNRSLSVSEMALFSGKNYAGKLNQSEMDFMELLRDHKLTGSFHISEETTGARNTPIIIDNAQGKSKIKVLQTKPYPKVQIELRVKSTLTTTLNELNHSEVLPEADVAKALEKEIEKVVRKLQTMKCDAIGVGMYVRNKMPYKEWNQEQWPETFSKADIHYKVHYRMDNVY